MFKKVNSNKNGVIEYSIDSVEDLDKLPRKETDNTVYATLNKNGKRLIYLYSKAVKDYILINGDLEEINKEINNINEQLDNIANNTLQTKTLKGYAIQFTQNSDFDVTMLRTDLLNKIKEIGVKNINVNLVVRYIVENVEGKNVTVGELITDRFTKIKVKEFCDFLRNLGFEVSIKFQINQESGNIDYMQKNQYNITLSDRIKFFNDYKNFMIDIVSYIPYLTHVAVANEIKALTYGDTYKNQWSHIIEELRSVTEGKIIYSPLEDEFFEDTNPLAEMCDYICLNYYPNSGDRYKQYKAYPCDLFTKELYKMEKTFNKLSKKYNKKIIVTEIGIMPYDYVHIQTRAHGLKDDAVRNNDVQTEFYKAIMGFFNNLEVCEGIILWGCSPQIVDNGFNIITNPAENIVKEYWR